MEPSPRNPLSASHIGNKRAGLMHRNCRSRLRMRWLSSQSRSRGPRVLGNGPGFIIVRCSIPPLTVGGGLVFFDVERGSG